MRELCIICGEVRALTLCPLSVHSQPPSATRQQRTVQSNEPDTTRVLPCPSDVTVLTSPLCPSITDSHAPELSLRRREQRHTKRVGSCSAAELRACNAA